MRQLTAWNNTQYGKGKGKGDRTQNGTWHSVAKEISLENMFIAGQKTYLMKLGKELRTE